MTTSTRKNFLLCLALVGVSTVSVWAQSNTIPAGYFTVNINAGTGSSYSTSVLSFPLQQSADSTVGGVLVGPTGQMVGQVTGITSTTITNTNAAWGAGQLSVAATPYLIQFTSGTATGRTFLISTTTANTATMLTLDSSETTDLTTLGIVPGTDTYQIVAADTISSVFGTPASTGVLGGTSVSNADTIQIYNGTVWKNYFYNTGTSSWTLSAPPINSNNVVIRPDTGVIYNRLANTPLSLVLMGQAPAIARQASVANSSITFLSNFWPTSTTLLTSNIQNIPGWVAGAFGTADTVLVFGSNNVWTQYYFNGTHWYQAAPPIVSDSVAIPAGSAVFLTKKASSAGQSILSQSLPYSLN